MKQEKEIELYSEEVQEVFGNVPPWILRWGITFLGLIVAVLIAGSYLFKYPDMISAELVLTTSIPPAGIVAKTSGKIAELRVGDQQIVRTGDCLAVIENPASYEDVLSLEKEINSVGESINKLKTYYLKQENLRLGIIQSSFSSFLINLENYNKFIELDYYPRKMGSVRQLIEANRNHYRNAQKRSEIVQQQVELEKKIYDREDYLKKQNLISDEENDKAKGQFLQSQMSRQNMQSELDNQQMQIMQLEGNLADLEQQYLEKKNSILSELNTNLTQLQNEIRSWKMTYVLSSPLDGQVTFTNYWSVNQNVTAGLVVFSVIPKIPSQLIAKAQLPAARSGKVKVGQSVNVHFTNFPDNEFGMVRGVVNRISLLPTDGKYVVEVKFPNGLVTTYNKKLPLAHEMAANAEIITNDLRLMDQFFLPMKRMVKNNIE
ncbi:MAG: hlyD 2 [Bacteroidetes bacterium]|nr:hlyD 2 [Bacteroidota bacterium]